MLALTRLPSGSPRVLKSLPDMIEKSSDPQLKQGFQAHQSETRNQVTRLEQVFRLHGQEPKGIDCPAIDGIIEEAEDVVGEVDDKSVLDAALIAAAQTVEHYEIHALRQPDRMGEGTRTQRLRGAPSTESGRGKSHRQETDLNCREQGQPHSGVAAGNCPPHPDASRGGGCARAALMVRDGARPEHQERRRSVSRGEGTLDHQQFTCANFREAGGKVIEANRCPSHVKHRGLDIA
jgi:hypothetical protein